MRIEPLTNDHDHSQFDCGDPGLSKYLKFALQARHMGLGRTFVVVEDDSNVVLGYYTRVPSSVVGESIPDARSKNPVPVFLLAKAGVNNGSKRQGIGKMMLRDFLEAAIVRAEEEAYFAVIVDALDRDAKDYYLQFGFKECADDPMRLWLPMKTVKKLVA